jgi:hypothetical protein
MKFSDISFPHPILGVSDTISGIVGFLKDPGIESYKDNYKIKIECLHDNADLSRLILEKQAEYFCEVNCSSTLYREIFKSDSNSIEFEISKKQVKGKVEFICLLVSKKNISNYVNSCAHIDYEGYTFNIDKGDILAFFGAYSFNADIKYERLKAVSEILTVIENSDVDYANIVLDNPKIEVQLPTAEYELFAGKYSHEEKYIPIFHSSIVLPSLLTALYNLKLHKEQFWAKAIAYRLENEKEFANLSIEEPENIPEIAQKLLGNPINRLMVGIDNIELINENDT